MTPEIAQSLEDFVSWKNCIACAGIAFGIAVYFLVNLGGNARRRLSALIDFFWTATSAAGIAAALLVFGDLVWKAHERLYYSTLHAGFDQLAQLDSAQLIALNCPGGKPVPDAQLDMQAGIKATDTPCLTASRIARWRQQLDEHSAEILKACAKGDLHYKTRNFTGFSSPGIVASCSPTGAVTPCLQARCHQEQDVAAISLDLYAMGNRFLGDTAVDGYRKAIADAGKVPLQKVHAETHPFDSAPFVAFIPLWAALFGMRLARAVSEFLDPAPRGEGVRKSFKRSVREIFANTRRRWAKDKRIARKWFSDIKEKFASTRVQTPAE